jgi:ribosomal-protein-serine acetyltransferase
LDDAVDWIASCQYGWYAGEHFAFALFDKPYGQLMGSAGLSQHDRLHRRANLGYWARQSRQREGVATTAVRHVAQFGFQSLETMHIEIVVLPLNQASRAAAEKSNARFEGMARQRLWTSAPAQDVAIYALIPQDML